MFLFAKFLQFIELLFDFMDGVLAIRKHFPVNSFKIINITKFDAADLILLITKYNKRFGFYSINELIHFFVYLVTPDADLLFFCMVYDFDGNFDRNHPRKFEFNLVNLEIVSSTRTIFSCIGSFRIIASPLAPMNLNKGTPFHALT